MLGDKSSFFETIFVLKAQTKTEKKTSGCALPVLLLFLVGLEVPQVPVKRQFILRSVDVCSIDRNNVVNDGHTISPFSPGVPQSPLSP